MANAPGGRDGRPVTIFGPDFPFPFDDWIAHRAGLGSIPAERHGEEVAVIGAGISGLVAAYELMKLGLKPVVYEASQMGGRLRSQPFEGAKGVVAELGGMRFPISSSSFYYYVDKLGLQTRPFPNPLTEAAGSTVVDLEGATYYAGSLGDLPGRDDQLRHGPAPDRRRRRAGAPRALALRRAPARPLAGRYLTGLAALRRAPARRRPDRP